MMIKTFQKLFIVFLPILLLPQLVYAHELIPKEVQSFLAEHPNATPEELQTFVQAKSPEFAARYKTKEAVIELIRNRSTDFWDNSLDFIKLGINHILSGSDHILFVLSILLTILTIKEILTCTATFTIAHSITLLLAGTGILVLPSHVVEPIIALSIAYTAFSTVFLAGRKFVGEINGKLAMIFVFGLFHGLGFAGLLKEIQIPADRFVSSLLSFNIGIELGQLTIVAIALPIFFLIRKTKWQELIIKFAAAGMTMIGIFWAVQRIFLS